MKLNIYTPNAVVYEGDVDSFTAYTHKGKIGVLQNHAPLIADLTSNILNFSSQGKQNLFCVWGGLFRFVNNEATILADSIENIEDIDINRAHEAQKRAKAYLKETKENLPNSTIDVKRATQALKRAHMRLKFIHMR